MIGVLGTEATVRQPYVDDLAERFASDCTIIRHGSPELVELAEASLRDDEVALDAVKAAAQPMFDAPEGERIDTVVLACTHFPLLAEAPRARFPRSDLCRRRAGHRPPDRALDSRPAVAGASHPKV